MKDIFFVILVIWSIAYILFFIYLYFIEANPYLSKFNEKYYKEIPDNLNPAELSILMYKKITPNVLTATIIFLINKNKFLVKKTDNDYVLVNNKDYKEKLSEGQLFVEDMLFNLISRSNELKVSEIDEFIKNKRNVNAFLNSFQLFKKIIIKEATDKQFFETKISYNKVKFFEYTGYLLFALNLILRVNSYMGYFIILPAYYISYYFYKCYKRTKKYNDDYFKWLGFRNYLMDIKKFNYKKDEIRKYFMYGIVLNITTLEKDILNRNDGFMTRLYNSINKCIVKSYFHGERGIIKRKNG